MLIHKKLRNTVKSRSYILTFLKKNSLNKNILVILLEWHLRFEVVKYSNIIILYRLILKVGEYNIKIVREIDKLKIIRKIEKMKSMRKIEEAIEEIK